MKVLWLTQFPYPNSNTHPAPWLISLAKELVKNNIDLTILSYYSKIKADESYEKDGIKFIFLKTPVPKIDLLSLYQIRINKITKFVQANYKNYDIIHVHGSECQLESAILKVNAPSVLSVQGIIFEYYKHLPSRFSWKTKILWKLSSIYEKKNLKKVNNYICRTSWDKSSMKTNNPSAVIYENWELLRPEFYDGQQYAGSTHVLFMGGKNVVKGIDETLEAFVEIKNKTPLKLLILGSCNKQDIQEIINTKNLDLSEKDYEVWGSQEAEGIKKAFLKSFCLLHPSYIDNSPNSICEAQIAGLPVIASNVGGVSSLIEHKKTGLLTTLNVQDISTAVIDLYNNRELQEKMAKEARILAIERHSTSTIVNKTIEIYSSVISSFSKN